MSQAEVARPQDKVATQSEEAHDSVDRDAIFGNYKSVFSMQFGVSLAVEFVGVMFFQIIGATATKEMAPFSNGFALAVWIYTAANISGGHLNPAVTASVLICGFFPLAHAVLYIVLQILGAMLGAWVTSVLVPGASLDMGDGAPGCFDQEVVHAELTKGQLFGWEMVMTFTLISCVYACGVAKPGHGSHTPFAVGLALVACAGSGGQYTGAALNPARVLGPRAVFGCGVGFAQIYVLAQLAAALAACSVFAFVSGFGPLNIYTSRKALGLSIPESVRMWVTGSPPKRLCLHTRDNIMDLLARARAAKKFEDEQQKRNLV